MPYSLVSLALAMTKPIMSPLKPFRAELGVFEF